jgi:uncharacterized protein
MAWRGWLMVFALAVGLRAAEVIPAAPKNHFNDYAGLVPAETARRLNEQLAQFERETSNQIVVAIFPRMQSESSAEDYTVRVAQAWGVGGRQRDNGAVLFMFQESRDVRIVTGYGMEGALPDALAKRIIEDEMIPRFRQGDFAGGLTAGVQAMMAATRGEYQGTGTTRATGNGPASGWSRMGIVFVILMLMLATRGMRRGSVYSPRGRRGIWVHPGGWGGGRGGGGGWGGGGGTFSGGGGSFGGGGAGGRW